LAAAFLASSDVISRSLVGQGTSRLTPLAVEGFPGRPLWNEAITASANQILTAGLLQGASHLEVVFWLEELE
jgi:hypothetical protein